MRVWGYYALHTFWNALRKVFRSTFVVVIVCCGLFGGLIGLSAGIIGSTFFPDDTEEETQNGYYDEDGNFVSAEDGYYDEDGNFVPAEGGFFDEDGNWQIDEDGNGIADIEEEMTEEDIRFLKLAIEAGVALLLLALLLIGIYSGAKKGSDIFLMADVNLLFTAPMKAQSVLMFRLSFQMAASLLASVYLLFQIPNLVLNFHLGMYAVFAILLAWVFMLFLQKLMSVLTYTVTATYPNLKKYVLPFVLGTAALVLVGLWAVFEKNGRELEGTLEALGAGWTRYIPVIGWYKGMIMTAVEGEIGSSFAYMAFLLVTMVLMTWGIWHIRADFYEDAMAGATAREELVNAAREGRKAAVKERSEKIKRNEEMKGFGANAFLYKEIYNRKRFVKLGFFTNTMLIYLALATFLPLFVQKVLEVEFDFLVIGVVIAAIMFFRNYGNPIAQETSGNWLFLVPDDPYKKVFFAMMAGTYATALDLLPAMAVGCILTGENPLLCLFWYVTLLLMDFMLSAVGMLLEAAFPASSMDVLKAMLQMMLKFFVLFILVILLVVGYLVGGIWLALILVNLCNVVFGAAGFVFYPLRLHDGIG